MRLIRIGSIGTRPWVMSWQKAVPSREAGEALPFKGRVGWGWLSRQPEQSAWQNRSVTEIHPHPDLPLEGEGAKRSCVVIGCRGTIVLIELARQLQRGGVAVAGGQRLEVDRPQRRFLHDVQQAFLGQLENGQERDHNRSEERGVGKAGVSTWRSRW